MRLIAWIALGVVAALVLLFLFLPVVAWILVGLVLLILLLVLFVPIGADIAYMGGEFSLAARADGLSIKLIPRKPRDPDKPPKEKKPKKEKKKKKPKKPKEEKPRAEGGKQKKKLSFTFDELLELAQKAIRGLGKFGKLTVHKFLLHYVAAGNDPYNTAMTYNYVNAALSVLGPVCAQKFRVRGDVDVWTDIDFTAEKMTVDTQLSITLRLAQVVHMAFAVGFGALGVLIKHKLRLRREKKEAAKAAVRGDEINQSEDPSTMIQDEERKDSHG